MTKPSPSRTPILNKRAIPRQATSAVAYEYEPPSPGDPLLQFTPVPHKQPRSNSITPDLQRAFIAHLAATGIVQSAARHIGKSMEALYKLRQRPGAESFRAAWDKAFRFPHAIRRAMSSLMRSEIASLRADGCACGRLTPTVAALIEAIVLK